MASTSPLPTSAVALPPASRVSGFYARTDLADAFAMRLPPGASTDPETLARFIFAQQPRWKHLDFRLSVLHETLPAVDGSASQVVLSTVVHCHNRLGRLYILLIAPFHRAIVQATLRRAARTGWPTALKP